MDSLEINSTKNVILICVQLHTVNKNDKKIKNIHHCTFMHLYVYAVPLFSVCMYLYKISETQYKSKP